MADFTASNTSGIQPLYVQFTDTSTTTDATIDLWAWDFGDGNTSVLQNPSHTYEVPGTHTANLTITNTSYSLVSTKLTTITVYKQPTADFSSFSTQGTAPFTTYFYDTSTNLNSGPYTYYTDFGDGNTSTEQNLYFTWNITGTYDVKHCITDSVTTACNNKTAYVTVGTATIAPVASFYGSPTTGNVPLTVFFTDVSSNTPTSWNWSFGDGIYSELQNPTHQYTRSGFKNVNLTATNSAGSNITVRLKFVRVN
jgi:PKD repeat protein